MLNLSYFHHHLHHHHHYLHHLYPHSSTPSPPSIQSHPSEAIRASNFPSTWLYLDFWATHHLGIRPSCGVHPSRAVRFTQHCLTRNSAPPTTTTLIGRVSTHHSRHLSLLHRSWSHLVALCRVDSGKAELCGADWGEDGRNRGPWTETAGAYSGLLPLLCTHNAVSLNDSARLGASDLSWSSCLRRFSLPLARLLSAILTAHRPTYLLL